MKKIIGITMLLLCIAFTGILLLGIWNIHIISLEELTRSSATLIILGIFIVVLIVLYGAFFRKQESGYHKAKGKHAHRKSSEERL